MKKNVIYVVYLCGFMAAIYFQLKYLFDLQNKSDAYSGYSFIVPGVLSYMVIGILLALESILAAKVRIWTKITGRMTVVCILAVEIFKFPLMKNFSVLNEWSYIPAAACVITAYLFVNIIVDVVLFCIKKSVYHQEINGY